MSVYTVVYTTDFDKLLQEVYKWKDSSHWGLIDRKGKKHSHRGILLYPFLQEIIVMPLTSKKDLEKR